ncbi:50S ribosomal protein L11 methyltransferase [Cystobacter ferrugineus]|uniref:Protein arginine N-methyltransferase domain-containing protein n=1 Tax=Cystobacter ferrugineus TaxID=83449 RepID=A0A1L9B4M2_9BACT|nr:50S ribosomal protein L11 methyltransferase [Cystobacter ferrugineus]OJH37208.1 hypothetical protein BON30_28245 [Cystobacter ferrugineus]
MSFYQLREEVIPLLLALASPMSPEELIRSVALSSGLPESLLRDRFEAIRKAGLLSASEDISQQSSVLFLDFATLGSQRNMLRDRARTDALLRAIREVVRPGDTVVDVGTGTGILAMAAAASGAKRVFAIERSSIANTARSLVEANGLADKIEFFQGDAADFGADIQADVIISEWIGHFLIVENMYPAFTAVRDRVLKPGGRTIPSGGKLFLAPIEDSALYQYDGPGFWEQPIGGFDYSQLKAQELGNQKMKVDRLRRESYLAEPVLLRRIDCTTEAVSAFYFESSVEFRIDRDAQVHGLAGHFELELAPGVVLDTSPFSIHTHWHQTWFPIDTLAVKRGDRLQVTFSSSPGSHVPSMSLTVRRLSAQGAEPARTYQYGTGLL